MDGNLFDLVSGIPGQLGSALSNLLTTVQGIKDDAEMLGETEIDVAGPEETIEGEAMIEGEELGAAPKRRRVQYRGRKAKTSKVKQASPATRQASSSLDSRVKRLEGDIKSFAIALKKKGIAKVAGSGNRALFSATAAATAAGATVTPAAVVGNADQQYDRVCFMANTPSLIANVTAAQNPLIDGSASVPVDTFPLGPIELAEPVKVNGNGGLVLTHTNRGAAAGDASVLLIPVGHSWGSVNPGSF